MPQAAAAFIVAAVGATGVAAVVVSAVVQLAIVIGLNSLIQAVFGKGGTAKPSDGQKTVRENVSSRKRHFGIVHVGGALSFYESRNGTLYAVITTGQGRIAEIMEHRLNNKAVTVDGSGVVTDAQFRGAIRIYSRMGEDDQTAVGELTAVFPEWTSNHRQRGCSLAALFFGGVEDKYFSEVYEGNAEPAYTRVIKAVLVYDPRADSTAGGTGAQRRDDPDTWEWSDNWALVTADYLAHADGYGLGVDNINWANVAEEADFCDEEVTTIDDRTIPRWRAWGSYALATDERRTVFSELLKAADGFGFQDADGLASLHCGRWVEPTVHLNEDHVLSVSASLGGDPMDRTNEVRVVYTDPRFDYSETESAPIIDAVAQARIGRSELQRYDLFYCPDHNQAQRVGKRILAKLGERWNLAVICNLFGLNALGQRFVCLTIAELGIEAVAFEVTGLRIDPMNNRIELGLSEVLAEDFDFDALTEEGDPPAVPGDTAISVTIPPPENLSLSASQINLGGTNGVAILAAFDPPARPGLTFVAEYRLTGIDPWLPMAVNQDAPNAITGIIDSGAEHEVRVKSRTRSGRESDYAPVETITPNAANAPAAPTDLGGVAGVLSADLFYRNPPADFGFVRIYRNTVNDLSTATAISDEGGAVNDDRTYSDSPLLSGEYFYWFRSFNVGGTLSSGAAGPVPVTVA